MNIRILGLVVCAVLVAAGVLWLCAYPSRHALVIEGQAAAVAAPAGLVEGQAARAVPAGLKEYRNERFHFSVLYPENLRMSDQIDQYGDLSVVFENDDSNDPLGFQIYVQPYTQPTVSEERFKKDLPSGVRDNLVGATVAGATGAAFYSFDERLGDTREVWFLNQGILYEVTTLKSLSDWLIPILSTWQFI